jgi:hypothetical protein
MMPGIVGEPGTALHQRRYSCELVEIEERKFGHDGQI